MLKENMALLFIFYIIYSVIHVSYSKSVGEYKSYEGYKYFQIEGSPDRLEDVVKNMEVIDEELVYDRSRTTIRMLVSPELERIFEEIVAYNNLKSQLIVDDYSKIIEMEKSRPLRGGDGFSWTAYYDVDEIYGYLQNVSRTYPGSTELVVGGQSYEGRQILGLRINTPTRSHRTNKPTRSHKPVMVIESGIHAREWITPATTTYFINQLLTNPDPEIGAMRDQFDWHIFPTVNPDGYHYSYRFDRLWRKTRSISPNGCRGADPNRNWDYNWLKHGASNNPCNYQTYGGAHPFSEIETRTLSEYVTGLENLLGYIAFHADAQMLLVPYSDSVEHTNNYDDLVQIGNTSLAYGYKVNGAEYDGPAAAAEILYKASGGSMDWVRDALGTSLVYTYELRGTYFYWPPSKIYQQGDEVTQMMLGLVTEARNLGYF